MRYPHGRGGHQDDLAVGNRYGMGLGLSVCHSLVRAMGGQIEVRTAVGQGTTFTVLLPALDSARNAIANGGST